MKTVHITRIFILALLVGFVSTFTTYAKSPAAVTAKNLQQKFTEVFQNTIDPENIPTAGTVVITFSINDDGKVEFKKIDSNNDDAENFVVTNISKVPCQAYTYPYHQVYKLKFRFDQN
jgi:hypothetical protein